MKGSAYGLFNISVHARQNAANGLWVPDIRVFSDHGQVQTLADGTFKTRGEAEARGIEIAKTWIDLQSSVRNC